MISTQTLESRNDIALLELLKADDTLCLLLLLVLRHHPAILLRRPPHHHPRTTGIAASTDATDWLIAAPGHAADAHLHVALAQLFTAADRVDWRECEGADWAVVCFAKAWRRPERRREFGTPRGAGDRVVVSLLRRPAGGEGGRGVIWCMGGRSTVVEAGVGARAPALGLRLVSVIREGDGQDGLPLYICLSRPRSLAARDIRRRCEPAVRRPRRRC